MDRAEGEVRPRVFFEDFPNIVLYVREVPHDGGLAGRARGRHHEPVAAGASSSPSAAGWWSTAQARTIQMVLEDGTRHSTKLDDPAAYEVLTFEQTIVVARSRERVPAHRPGARRARDDDRRRSARRAPPSCEAQGMSPHNPIMEIHKKFSIPVACFVFALLGVALGASNRKDGKLAASCSASA